VRFLGAGGGTSLPGLFLEHFHPSFLRDAVAGSQAEVVIVTGTNGKTTTASMIRHSLRSRGATVAGNEEGSNMTRGVWTSFLDVTPATDYVVLEVDEAVASDLVQTLRPRVLVLTNVFRDQLDRFGEAESVAALLGKASRSLQRSARLVVNLDDPLLAYEVKEAPGVQLGFGVDAQVHESPDSVSTEPQICPRCHHEFRYRFRTIGHLGAGHCSECGWSCGEGGTRARIVEGRGLDGVDVQIEGRLVRLSVGGVHAAYNAAAAVTTLCALGVPASEACRSLESFVPRFGRGEVLDIGGVRAHVLLMKNPAGADAVIDEACLDPRLGTAVCAVNDKAADGRDISWIWDVDFESLVRTGIPLIPSGSRAKDVAVRIKYAGGNPLPALPDLAGAMREATRTCPPGKDVVVFATYTAMLELRRGLAQSWGPSRANAFR
jgi:UDP-N-acetylmuramyl tripeptide synthase